MGVRQAIWQSPLPAEMGLVGKVPLSGNLVARFRATAMCFQYGDFSMAMFFIERIKAVARI
jgi:hypothetical protein